MNWQDDARFSVFVEWVLDREGRYLEDVPGDQGGLTHFGIDYASAQNWGFTPRDIRNLTEEQSKEIYFDRYWLATGAPDLPYPVGELICDIRINGGSGGFWLQ